MKRCTIYWRVNNIDVINKIRTRFCIPKGISVNGISHADIKDEDWELFQETEKRGYIQIRKCKTINKKENE